MTWLVFEKEAFFSSLPPWAFATSLTGLAEAADRLRGEYGTVWVTNRTLHNVAAFDAGTGATAPVEHER